MLSVALADLDALGEKALNVTVALAPPAFGETAPERTGIPRQRKRG